MMLAKPRKGETLVGNDRYEGYCKVIQLVLINKEISVNRKLIKRIDYFPRTLTF